MTFVVTTPLRTQIPMDKGKRKGMGKLEKSQNKHLFTG